ncbi:MULTISPECIES: GNAT family N-acetyltransferase [Okeania]|uniref:GNAT family N-acetyltransferase n=1 Tax=Okeania hirsuta TaxID=1458930 RepID=A0A3N6Q8E3_9CYAN|nr:MULTISPECIES: GNAT family N-acetyltransferase [Okeania]NET17156.1 GNAT family N-acetyltransferase [Okeania sp. SIO1H6]NEP73082.1 GNAT family N-acetyltransferase [Okeania sp. SIO2G5]NEP91411.1 GNAT family N-acetyltransferase [Okeania sp. SIO2C2]NEP93970.1 GNAT family N-acetyltransferase [Okeania sp. SIO2F5]NEQ93832.1 GNAT family N-acetyltransferase [Okeania sp. SIO2G4]
MGFWKNLFSGSEPTSHPQNPDYEGYTTIGEGKASSQAVRSPNRSNGRIFFSTDRDIDIYELEELCNAVGWSRRPLRKVKKAIQHSFLVVSMWQMRGSQKRLIGFARATSDHAFNATLWDVVVHPDVQGKGLGKALMKYIIKKLRSEDISNITLFADPHVVDFYHNLGFISDPEGIKGMFWYPD